jgi:trk system potassium uptake protein TrkH
MNYKLVAQTIGKLLIVIALAMCFPFFLALADGSSDRFAFAISILITLLVGATLSQLKSSGTPGRKEGFAIVSLGWITAAALGALPLVISGAVPTYTDAYFEVMSGFTTTGSTVIPAVEAVPRGILLWRGLTQWLGGMGIIVLSLALFSFSKTGTTLFQAEVPGHITDRILPRLGKSAGMLWLIYAVITVAMIIVLCIAGMPLFESIVHTFATVSTGGFSARNISINAYHSPVIEAIIIFFMIICGMNFSLFYRVIQKKSLQPLFRNAETRGYLAIILAATIIIAVSLITAMGLPLLESFRQSAFQVSSIITTTGFSSTNFDLWPALAKGVLLVLMLIGASTGSTAGAIKVARILLLFKYLKRQVQKAVNPKLVLQTRLGDTVISDTVMHEILAFFFMYICLFVVGALIVMGTGQDIVTSISASATAIGNNGPGLAAVGPTSNFSRLHGVAKWTMSFLMLAGRLEILTLLSLFSVRFWRD